MTYPKFTGTEPCTQVGWEHFYLQDGSSGWTNLNKMRALCAGCPMQVECLEYALEHERYGFWAGTTENERARIRKSRTLMARKERVA